MIWATPHLVDLIAAGAGLVFEMMVIASLYVATATGVLIAARGRRSIGLLSGMALFSLLAGLLIFAGPLTTLCDYAACVDRASPRCQMG